MQYIAPNSDTTRLTFMEKAVQTATDDAAIAGGTTVLPAQLLTDLTAHYNAFDAADRLVKTTLGDRKAETAESAAAMAKVKMYTSHMRTAVYHRTLREEQPDRVLTYYGLNRGGVHPIHTARREQLRAAKALIAGDAEAVTAGYPPSVNPSAAELQVVYDAAIEQVGDVPQADRRYDEAQAAIAAMRPEADRLIRSARAAILYATHEMDAASQRRMLRNYGARYYYAPGEKVDDGDETAVFELDAG